MRNIMKDKLLLAILSLALLAAIFLFRTSSQSAVNPVTATSSEVNIPSDLEDYMLGLTRVDYTTYTHPVYGFSFHYPKDFVISEFQEDHGEVILAENPRFSLGLQIFITPFDEEGPITKERILQDLPALTMEDEVEFWIDDKIPALRFSSKDPTLGDTREIWFVRDGNLFQIMVYSESEEWLDERVREFAQDLKF